MHIWLLRWHVVTRSAHVVTQSYMWLLICTWLLECPCGYSSGHMVTQVHNLVTQLIGHVVTQVHMWLLECTCGYSSTHVIIQVHMWLLKYTLWSLNCTCGYLSAHVLTNTQVYMWLFKCTYGHSSAHVVTQVYNWLLKITCGYRSEHMVIVTWINISVEYFYLHGNDVVGMCMLYA